MAGIHTNWYNWCVPSDIFASDYNAGLSISMGFLVLLVHRLAPQTLLLLFIFVWRMHELVFRTVGSWWRICFVRYWYEIRFMFIFYFIFFIKHKMRYKSRTENIFFLLSLVQLSSYYSITFGDGGLRLSTIDRCPQTWRSVGMGVYIRASRTVN